MSHTALWVALGFLAGLIVGGLWREAFELLTGRDDPMNLFRRLARLYRRVAGHRTTLATWAVVASMIVPATVGVALIVDRHERSDLVSCLRDYNNKAGEARDDRLVPQNTAAEAEIDYLERALEQQRGLLRTAEGGHLTPVTLSQRLRIGIATTERYLATLEDLQKVRADHDYPPPDYCG